MKTRLFLIVWVCAVLGGCSTYTEVKSPCDYYGFMCGTKHSINQ